MTETDKKPYQNLIENLFSVFLQSGFIYEYTYDKGSDSSCVYIYRFRKGKDYFDLRAVSGGKNGSFVVYAGGEFIFPNLRLRHKKEFRSFNLKHLFKKATTEELWALAARLLSLEISDGNFFGISL